MSAAPKLPGMVKALGGPAGVGLAAVGAVGIGLPVLGEITGGASRERIARRIREGYSRDYGAADQMRRLAELMQDNEANLALLEPHVYAELLIGRKLGRGTRVYGSPNRDTLDKALLAMSKGAFAEDTT